MTDLPLMIHHDKMQCKSWIPICITEVMYSLHSKPLNHNNSRIIKVDYIPTSKLRIKVTKRSKQYTVIVREDLDD